METIRTTLLGPHHMDLGQVLISAVFVWVRRSPIHFNNAVTVTVVECVLCSFTQELLLDIQSLTCPICRVVITDYTVIPAPPAGDTASNRSSTMSLGDYLLDMAARVAASTLFDALIIIQQDTLAGRVAHGAIT